MHTAGSVFGTAGIVNQTGGWNSGLAFLFGLLSVQWTVRLYFPCFEFNSLRGFILLDDNLLPFISRKAAIMHA